LKALKRGSQLAQGRSDYLELKEIQRAADKTSEGQSLAPSLGDPEAGLPCS